MCVIFLFILTFPSKTTFILKAVITAALGTVRALLTGLLALPMKLSQGFLA